LDRRNQVYVTFALRIMMDAYVLLIGKCEFLTVFERLMKLCRRTTVTPVVTVDHHVIASFAERSEI